MIKDFPAELKPDSESWGIRYNTQTFSSDLNGAEQTRELPGAKWKCTRTYTQREGAAARELQGFLVSLRGKAGRFWVVPSDWQPNGSAAGSPVTSTAVSAGVTTFLTNGWDANQAKALATGDWFEINGELKKVVSPVVTDGSGNATVEFGPALRVGVGAGTALRLTEPRCKMKVTADDNEWNVTSPIVYAQDLEMVEALD